MAAAYDYLFLTLGRLPTPHQALAEQLASMTGGGEAVGQFAAQLGWAGNEAAVLVRWPDGVRGDLTALLDPPLVSAARTDRLAPGGIYVHRWFEVDAGAVDEFVALSGQGWQDFEAKFDARIFSLFRA